MTQTQLIEDRLRRMILDMDIGPGERLTERWLETQLQTSRTSVRAVLFRLETEGLIARNGRSWIVPPIDLDEVRQLFIYREVLEVAALQLGGATASAAELEEMEAILDAMHPDSEPEQRDSAGRRFHLLIGGLAKNEFISRGIADCMTRLLRVRWIEIDAEHEGWTEHRAVLHALRNEEVDRAIELTRQHLSAARERLLGALSAGRRTLRARGIVIS
ncbi:GntR family transcriptional regulator [Burkholderia savannae]|uniref:GntR family transcriptional regulator n=1 Tax=Burkholderia savannae TaxID=1637837 RepID=UPI000753F067|nr:GntR family transcriptional regulator [Burkholderia savannae]AOJ85173.1 GntR family transcriptional regulator [Burkholderia savannae]